MAVTDETLARHELVGLPVASFVAVAVARRANVRRSLLAGGATATNGTGLVV